MTVEQLKFESADRVPVSIRQLVLFASAARLRNVTRAARECGLSQPAATQALAALQSRVGCALIERSANGISLTSAGDVLRTRSGPILERLENALGALDISNSRQVLWHLTSRNLRSLAAIGRDGTLAKAAIGQGVPVRNLARSIRELEVLTGSELLNQSKGSSGLTDGGMLMAKQAAIVLLEMEWAIEVVRNVADTNRHTILIGVAPDPGTASLSEIAKGHVRQGGSTCLEIVEAGQDVLLAKLAIGEIDMVVGHILEDPRDDLVWEPLASASFRVMARREHPLALRDKVSLAELAEQSWILGARGSERRAASDLMFAGWDHPACALVTSAPPLMAQVMEVSDLVGLMTDQELAIRKTVLTALNCDAPDIVVSVGWARRAGWIPRQAHIDVTEALKRRFAALGLPESQVTPAG